MIKKILMAVFFLWMQPVAADEQGCGPVKIDCKSHEMTIGKDKEVKIDCGKSGSTPNCEHGKVGGRHNGTVVSDGVKIENCGNMFETGKVFHLGPNAEPAGEDISKGCIHVSAKILSQLKKCEGSTLEIKGGGSGGSSEGSSQGAKGTQSGPASR